MDIAEQNDQERYASIEGYHQDEPGVSVLDQIQNLNIEDVNSTDGEYDSDLEEILN